MSEKIEEQIASLKLRELISTLKFQRKELLRIIERGDGGNPKIKQTIEEGRIHLAKVEELLELFGQGVLQKRNQN